MTISRSTATPTITLDQWLERAGTWKKATKELVLLWFENNLGTQKQLADHLCLTPQAISKQKAKLITSGELNAVMDKSKTPKAHVKKVDIPVENSDQEIEQVNVTVHDPQTPPTTTPSSSEQSFSPAATERPKSKTPSATRPKELRKMLDAQTKYIDSRLLPIAEKLSALLEELTVEHHRLHGAWSKDNLVFTQPYQKCVKYWDECEKLAHFGEVLNDPTATTYAAVLERIEQMFKRGSERMQGIRYATGCIPEPNKRDLRL